MRIPARIIREEVKKRGGQCSKVHLPREKTLDQVAYIKTTKKIDTVPLKINLREDNRIEASSQKELAPS
jgi:hypothetical protein